MSTRQTHNDEITCDICYETAREATQTPCAHNFCNKCLTQWLMLHTSCPSCRYAIGCDNSEDQGAEDVIRHYNCRIRAAIGIPKHVAEKIKESISDLILYVVSGRVRHNTYKWKFNPQDYSTTIITKNIMYMISADIIELINPDGQLPHDIGIDIYISYKIIKKLNYKWERQQNRVKHLKKSNTRKLRRSIHNAKL